MARLSIGSESEVPPRRRAVITGLGVLAPIGTDLASFWSAAVAGTSGIRPIQNMDATSLPSHIGGELVDYDPKKFIPASNKDGRKSLKNMARTVHMGVCAAQLAMDDHGPAKGTIDPFRFGIEFGCVMVATEIDDLAHAAKLCSADTPGHVDMAKWGTEGLEAVTPNWMLKYLPNMSACHTSIFFDAQGPNNTITEADASGILALGEAYRIMQRDLADFFLVGGTESKINPVSFVRHNLFTPFTRNNAHPTEAVRPFDAARDGIVFGEAAAAVGLEDLEHARKRGVPIYAEVVGFASGFDRGLTGDVLIRILKNALVEAKITPADVDHVNAQAAGSPKLDAFEARAIHAVFGPDVPVYCLKGQVGSTGAASGLLELAVSLLAFKHGVLPGTVNHTTPDPACPVNVVTGSPRPITKPYMVKISYTDVGQCAVAVLRRFED